jgi:hypothetical protein
MIDFSKDDKYAIAEFVFSFQTDVLITSDATRLVDVLAKHELITDKDNWHKRITAQDSNVCSELFDLCQASIPNEQGKAIMDEYYKG